MVSILIDDQLLLRSFQPEDAAALFHAVDASRNHLRIWFPWVDMTTKQEHSLQFIQQAQVQQHQQQAMSLGIVFNGEIIGSMGMHGWDHELKRAQLGYWIKKEYEGKGIVHACLLRFIDFLFEKVNLNKVEIQFITTNARSASVARRAGFTIEGVIRQSHMLNGRYMDMVVTGLLRSEWKGLPENPGKTFIPT